MHLLITRHSQRLTRLAFVSMYLYPLLPSIFASAADFARHSGVAAVTCGFQGGIYLAVHWNEIYIYFPDLQLLKVQ